jgi:uncharacterized membrane protein
VVLVLSLGAAIAFACASVLQYQASASSARELNLRFGLLVRLLSNPRFGIGAAFDILGGIGQFLALKYGSVTEVLPVLTSGFVLAIVLEHLLARRRIPAGEAVGLMVSALALVAFLVLAPDTTTNVIYVRASAAIALGGIALGGSAITWLRPRLTPHAHLQAFLGAVLLGVAAVFEREVGILWSTQGTVATLEHWELWALVVVGALALLLVQSSFQRQRLSGVLPIVTVGEPVAAIVLSTLALDTPLLRDRGAGVASLCALAIEIGALVYLARREVRPRLGQAG